MTDLTLPPEAIQAGAETIDIWIDGYAGEELNLPHLAKITIEAALPHLEAALEAALRAKIAADLAFTDKEWAEYQAIPDQGYSHRHWLDQRAARIAERNQS